MRHAPFALPILLAAAALAQAGEVVKLDAPPKAVWVTVQADPVITTLSLGGDKPARWVLVDEHPAADLRPSTDGKTADFAAMTDGQYRVLVIAGEDVHRLKLVKATAPPQPMPPGPDPQPKPPDPKPPAPADPLVKLLQAGYDADTRTREAKESDRLDLVELYRQAAVLAAVAEVTTTGQLVGKVREAAKALGVVGLTEVRKVVGGELMAAFPEDTALTADSRKRAADLFKRIQMCLQEVK